jgi:hypothetical protein
MRIALVDPKMHYSSSSSPAAHDDDDDGAEQAAAASSILFARVSASHMDGFSRKADVGSLEVKE